MMRFSCVLALLNLLLATVYGQDRKSNSVQLTLPSTIHAVAGVPAGFYFDNVVLSKDSAQYRFEISCDVGVAQAHRWSVTATEQQIGSYALKVSVFKDQERIDSAETTLRVISERSGEKRDRIRLMIVGDSLTHASVFPNELARLLSQPGNPKWRMIGSHKPTNAADGVFHEGYGGWTWARFASHYEPNPDGTHRKRSSPFVFPGDNGRPHLDISRYFGQHCDGTPPDYIVIMLGINDCFRAPADDSAGVDEHISTMFQHADKLLLAIQAAAPGAQIGLCLTTPPNSRQAAFEANYQNRYTRWGWKRIQHRLVQRQIQYVAENPDLDLSVIPTQLNPDPVNGYPDNNGVHPNEEGYKDIGRTIYAWLKSKLANESVASMQLPGRSAQSFPAAACRGGALVRPVTHTADRLFEFHRRRHPPGCSQPGRIIQVTQNLPKYQL